MTTADTDKLENNEQKIILKEEKNGARVIIRSKRKYICIVGGIRADFCFPPLIYGKHPIILSYCNTALLSQSYLKVLLK